MSSVDDPYLTSAAWLVFVVDCVSSHLSPAMSLLA
jgi:hypothetical protein